MSTWRSLAREGKLAVASSAEAVDVEPQPQPAFAALEVDSATGPGPMGSVVIESREVTVRLDGAYRRFAGGGDCLGVAGASMNVAGTGMRVVVATRPVDFRKGHDGLAAVVEHELGLDPYSGVVFVFRPKRVDRVKVLYWDGTRTGARIEASGAGPVRLAGGSRRGDAPVAGAVRGVVRGA